MSTALPFQETTKKSYNGLGTVSLRIYNTYRDDAVHHTESERE